MTTKKRRYSVFGDDDEETPPVEPLASNAIARPEADLPLDRSNVERGNVATVQGLPSSNDVQLPSETVKNLNAATVERANSKTAKQGNKATVKQSKSKPVEQAKSETDLLEDIKTVQRSLYFSDSQWNKLKDYARTLEDSTGLRISENDIIRYLVDNSSKEQVIKGRDSIVAARKLTNNKRTRNL